MTTPLTVSGRQRVLLLVATTVALAVGWLAHTYNGMMESWETALDGEWTD